MQLRPTFYIACTHVNLMVCGDVSQETRAQRTFYVVERTLLFYAFYTLSLFTRVGLKQSDKWKLFLFMYKKRKKLAKTQATGRSRISSRKPINPLRITPTERAIFNDPAKATTRSESFQSSCY